MKSKEKLHIALIVSAMVVVLVAVIILYSFFIQDRIFEESSTHLAEIYSQTNDFFQKRVESHRNILLSWEKYIKEIANDPERSGEFQEFIDTQKENLNVTRFSFVRVDIDEEDHNNDLVLAKDRDGRVYSLELRRSASVAFGSDSVAVACMRDYYGTNNPNPLVERTLRYYNGNHAARDNYDPDMRFIMIGVKFSDDANDTYLSSNTGDDFVDEHPFRYNGIALFFDIEAISYALASNAFVETIDGKQVSQSSCFLVLPNGLQASSQGLVLLQNTSDKFFKYSANDQWNFLDFLRENTKMKDSEVEDLLSKWQHVEQPETILFRTNEGKQYYLNYNSVGFNDWVLVGVVPADVVNQNMTSLRTITIIVMAIIFIIMGSGVAWFLIMADKRKMRDQEIMIKSRENLFDLLTYNTNDIFALFDSKTGEAEYVSRNVESVLGLDLEEIKQNVYRLMAASQADVQELIAFQSNNFDDGFVIDEMPMKNLKNQNPYWYRLTINPTQHRGKTGHVLMLSDRTHEKDMRGELESALTIAKSANEAKSNFLSNMSHDLRTPMNAIIGFATLLARDVENPDKVREYIRKISFSSRHMLSLINDILDMSKIESGKSAWHVEEFSLPEMLEELYSIIISQVQAKKQNFEMRTKGSLPERVIGDKLRLNQVIINLLSNAVKYTPNEGNVTLTVEALEESVRNHAHLRISVKDNGLGMSEEFVKVIFEPFSRENTDAKREIQGTGLGMAITKQIVDLMGGTITVKSQKDVGSEFIVEIELAKVMKTYSDPKEFWLEHKIGRMLVIDDEEDVCLEVKELMSDSGVVVDYAMSGQAAIDKINEAKTSNTKYDIILIDWKMPEMDGLEAAKQIRKITDDHLPIIVLTSYNFEEIQSEADEVGIHACLPKPFFVSNFRTAVAKLKEESSEFAPSAPAANEAEFSLEGLNILAAEDNPLNAEILEELLDIEGAKCTLCENGKIAVETFEKSQPGTYDMIFMDVQMPVMNGHEASRAIRASSHPDAKTIPIIAMTANAFDDDKKMAYDAGMNAHVAKPIDMDVLKKTVAKLHGGSNE